MRLDYVITECMLSFIPIIDLMTPLVRLIFYLSLSFYSSFFLFVVLYIIQYRGDQTRKTIYFVWIEILFENTVRYYYYCTVEYGNQNNK